MYLDTKKIDFGKLEVVNILEEVLVSENRETMVNEKVKLDLNNLPSGAYFIRAINGVNVYSERFLINKSIV